MPWPMSQDYNEAIQTPSVCFRDPDLQTGQPVCNALGLPQPCAGNFADVYALRTPRRQWAIKCFARDLLGIRERYAELGSYLARQSLPFLVEFQFLDPGIRVHGQWHPVLKMHWAEGVALHHFVKQQVNNPAILSTLGHAWLRLAVRLREMTIVHGDLQPSNILVAADAQPRLVDYDGMYVPTLESLPTGEVGHANFQHPHRLRDGIQGIDVDRFPLLLIYTALRALTVGGADLWHAYDRGDNLLFTHADLCDPQGSALFRELQGIDDSEVRRLTDALAEAARKPLDQTPHLDELVGVPSPTVAPTAAETITPDVGSAPRRRSARWPWLAGGAVAALLALSAGAFFMMGNGAKKPSIVQAPTKKRVPRTQPTRPVQEPEVAVEPKIEPKVEPKIEPTPEPKIEKIEPKRVEPKIEPKIEPKPEPKVEPKVQTKIEPKIEPPVVPPIVVAIPVADRRVPDDVALAEGAKFIKQQLASSYAKVPALRTATDKRELADKLLSLVLTIRDNPGARYFCYREARDVLASVPDPAGAMAAVDRLGQEFTIDEFALKTEALEAAGRAPSNPASNQALFDAAVALVEAALAEEKPDLAIRLAKCAQVGAIRLRQQPLISAAGARLREAETFQRDFQRAQAALKTLETLPDDADANLLLGKFRIFAQGNYEQGLPLLAKGADPKLQELARRDLAGAKDAAEQLALGDAWYDLAELEPSLAKKHLQRRAGFWYQQALPSTTGLEREKLEQRLKTAGTGNVLRAAEKRQPTVHVLTDADFARLSAQLPPGNNLAQKGTAKASSQYRTRSPQNALAGNRQSHSWYMEGAEGTFEANWDPAVEGRYVLLFVRPATIHPDDWGKAECRINNGMALPLVGVTTGRTVLIDLGRQQPIHKLHLTINGRKQPGLAAVEIHR